MRNTNKHKKIWLLSSGGALIFLSVFLLYRNQGDHNKSDTPVISVQLPMVSQTPKNLGLSPDKTINKKSKLAQNPIELKNNASKANLSAVLSDITPKHKEDSSNDSSYEVGPSLDNLLLLSPSLLSFKEETKAIDCFESQRCSWLAVKSGSAEYKTMVRRIRDGEFTPDAPSQSGTLEFVITPSVPEGHKSPAKIQAHLFDNKSESHSVSSDVLDWEMPWWQWTEDPTFPISRAKQVYDIFQTELLFFPLDFMAKTYSDQSWHNKYTTSREEFFADRGVPRRRSTEEETEQTFGGEPQYLFMASPGLIDAHYWFSAENGELRQIDVFLPNDMVKSFRYEDYVQKKGGDAKFPQKFILTCKWKEDNSIVGTEHTIDLSRVRLNTDISTERFIPPEIHY